MTQLWFPGKLLPSDTKKPTMQRFWKKTQTLQQRHNCAALPNTRYIPCTSSHNLFWKSRWHFRAGQDNRFMNKIKKWFSLRPPEYLSNATSAFQRRNAHRLRRGRVCFARGKGQNLSNKLLPVNTGNVGFKFQPFPTKVKKPTLDLPVCHLHSTRKWLHEHTTSNGIFFRKTARVSWKGPAFQARVDVIYCEM